MLIQKNKGVIVLHDKFKMTAISKKAKEQILENVYQMEI